MIGQANFHQQWMLGARLASLLSRYQGCNDLLIVGVPGGSMVIAAAIAETLDAPLAVVQPALLQREPDLALPDTRDATVLFIADGRDTPEILRELLVALRAPNPAAVVLVMPRITAREAVGYRDCVNDIVTLNDTVGGRAFRPDLLPSLFANHPN